MKKRTVGLLLITLLVFVLSGCNKEEGKEFYADGSLKGKGTLQADGKKEGKWKYFYGNGLMMSEGKYKDGYKVGKWKYWNKNGKLITVRDHKMEDLHTNETAHVGKDNGKAESAGVKKVETGTATSGKPTAEAPKAARDETASHETKSEPQAPLAATMEEWKARAGMEKAH